MLLSVSMRRLPGSVMACRSQPTCFLALADCGYSHSALSAKNRFEIPSLTSLAVWFTGMGGLWFYMSVLQKDVVF